MDGMAREEAELKDWLVAQGSDPERVAQAIAEGRADALASDLTMMRGADLSARDVAARTGMELDKVLALYYVAGVAVPDVDAKQFTESDALLVSRLSTAVDVGIVRGDDLLRVIAGAME